MTGIAQFNFHIWPHCIILILTSSIFNTFSQGQINKTIEKKTLDQKKPSKQTLAFIIKLDKKRSRAIIKIEVD